MNDWHYYQTAVILICNTAGKSTDMPTILDCCLLHVVERPLSCLCGSIILIPRTKIALHTCHISYCRLLSRSNSLLKAGPSQYYTKAFISMLCLEHSLSVYFQNISTPSVVEKDQTSWWILNFWPSHWHLVTLKERRWTRGERPFA